MQLVGEVPPASVRVDGEPLPWSTHRREGHWSYDAATAAVVVSLPGVDLRGETVIELERAAAPDRAAVEALLDGVPGLARRLDLLSESTRTLLEADNRRVISLSQAVDRIARDPSTLGPELTTLRRRLEHLDDVLERYVATWTELASLTPQDPPLAVETLESARRLLATTRTQLQG